MPTQHQNRLILIKLFGLEWVRERDKRLVKKINKQLKLEI